MPDWLVFSLIASLLLTVGLNALLVIFPGVGRTAEQRFLNKAQRAAAGKPARRIVFPWKTMLLVSVLGTLALNLFF